MRQPGPPARHGGKPRHSPGVCLLPALLAAAALTGLPTGPTAAYHFNGRCWPQMPIRYAINVASAPVTLSDGLAEEVVRLATEAW
ncbi:MAG: hypothetical protein FJ125_12395, partial [Deltaproteobacteria bacterium]|nr:hypothetical protein [Deltaproteobacteria bacterium]